MSIISFLKLVEIQTKVASLIPFLLGTVFALYRYEQFNTKNFLFMFISLLAFDMAATAMNNYYDYKNAVKKYGYNYEQHNAISRDDLSERSVIIVVTVLLNIAILAGVFLFANSDSVVLILGVISFLVGIFYSFGPVPISRMPLGEFFSGFFMGFIIVFIAVYIHVYDQGIISILVNEGITWIGLDFEEIVYLFLVSIPAVMGIANIMLANNICDIEDDIENRRYTLPVYIGKKDALILFKSLYYIIYFIIIVSVFLNILSPIVLLTLLTLLVVVKNIKLFSQKQSKADTFVLSVKNFVLINLVYLLTIGVSILL